MPIRWPEGWPNNTLKAMRAAIFAQSIGRAVAFSLAAFRQAFAGGKDLSDVDNVLIAAAACELHPNAVLKALETQSVKDRLREATPRRTSAASAAFPRSPSATSSSTATTASRRPVPPYAARNFLRREAPLRRRRGSRPKCKEHRLAAGVGAAFAAVVAAHAATAVAHRMRDRFGGEPPDPPGGSPQPGESAIEGGEGWVLSGPMATSDATQSGDGAQQGKNGEGEGGNGGQSPERRSRPQGDRLRRGQARPPRQGHLPHRPPEDAPHPPLRGARRRDVREGEDRRLPPPLHRRGGHHRRRDAGAARQRTT